MSFNYEEARGVYKKIPEIEKEMSVSELLSSIIRRLKFIYKKYGIQPIKVLNGIMGLGGEGENLPVSIDREDATKKGKWEEAWRRVEEYLVRLLKEEARRKELANPSGKFPEESVEIKGSLIEKEEEYLRERLRFILSALMMEQDHLRAGHQITRPQRRKAGEVTPGGEYLRPTEETAISKIERSEVASKLPILDKLFLYNSPENGWSKLLLGHYKNKIFLILNGKDGSMKIDLSDLEESLEKIGIYRLNLTEGPETPEQLREILINWLLDVFRELGIRIGPSAIQWVGELQLGKVQKGQRARGASKQPRTPESVRRSPPEQPEAKKAKTQQPRNQTAVSPETLQSIPFLKALFSLNGRGEGYSIKVFRPAGPDTQLHLIGPDGKEEASITIGELKRACGVEFIFYPWPNNQESWDKFKESLAQALREKGLSAPEVVI